MINEFEDKGKIFTNIVSKSQVPVQIQTCTNLIRGMIHIGLDERFKDELNKSEMFIAITDASVFNLKGKLVHRCKFLALNLNHVVWIYQDEAKDKTGDDL
ncbi:MAG: hypothetical protein LLG42_01095 [Chloroflexi bacterium]|nr:hypothetical protein [Chloroflexota bacterium]